MTTIYKTIPIEIERKSSDGGRIVISTGDRDRDKDRVLPSGALIDNYLKNPVVQYGHNYREPWATVGKTTALEITPAGIVAEFELRPAANDSDPQNVVRLLWEGEWIRTASIGFIPIRSIENEVGGYDYEEWELLEWSLIPIPSNQAALRLASKALDGPAEIPDPSPAITPSEAATINGTYTITDSGEWIAASWKPGYVPRGIDDQDAAPTDDTEPDQDGEPTQPTDQQDQIDTEPITDPTADAITDADDETELSADELEKLDIFLDTISEILLSEV